MTRDTAKTKAQLIAELQELRARFSLAQEQEESKLAQERQLLSTVLDNLPVSVYIKDLKGRKILVNNVDLELVGRPKEEVLGKTDAELFPPEVAENFWKDDQAVLVTGQAVRNREELALNQSQGRQFWQLTSKVPLYDASGKLTGLVGIGVDITERKRIEEELSKSRALFHSLVESIPHNVLSKDVAGRFTFANRQHCLTDRKTLDEIIGKTDFELYPPELAAQYRADDIHVMKTGQVIEREELHQSINGENFYVEVVKAPVYDANNQVTGVIGVFWDITERKQAQDELSESRARFQSLVESMPQNVFSKDLAGRFIFANQRYCATEGKPLEAILGKTDFDLHPPELAQQYWADDLRVIETGQIIEQVETHQPLGGEKSWVQVVKAPIYDANNHINGMLGIFWDVTDRKRAEQALRESETHFRSIVESSPVGYHIYTLEADGRLVFSMFNPAADAILRASHAQFMGREILEAFPALAGTGIPEMYTTVAKGELETQNFESTYDHNGIRGVYDVRVFQGAPGQAVVNFVDISERKQAEEIIFHAQKNLAAKNKELEQIVYVASHDLRSPLVNVDGFSRELQYSIKTIGGALEENASAPSALEQILRAELPDMENSLSRIRNSTRQMDTLLKGLLKLSRSGRAALHIASLDMNELMSQVCASFAFHIQEADVELTVQELPTCLGDAVQLTQVFANLIDNAIKYRHPQRQCQVRIHGQVEGTRAVYRVEDNGIGIAENHQKNIFELFHRLNPAANEGEGLGLTIARQVLDRLDGEIKVESRPGVGSAFLVSLPHAPGRKDG